MLSCCWKDGPVVVRGLGGRDWYPRSGQAVDLPVILGKLVHLSALCSVGVCHNHLYNPKPLPPKGLGDLLPWCLRSACLNEHVHHTW